MAVFFAFRPDVHADNDPFLLPLLLNISERFASALA